MRYNILKKTETFANIHGIELPPEFRKLLSQVAKEYLRQIFEYFDYLEKINKTNE
jgi:hypothetical protein